MNFENSWETFRRVFVDQEGYKVCWQGLGVTFLVAILGLLIGIVIGTLLAVVKVLPNNKTINRILKVIVDIYVGFFRGTPIVVQLLIGYFVIPSLLGITLESVPVCIMVFGLNSGAYVSEIMRGGIQSVDIGQMEAGRALGLSFGTTMLKIIVPQAVKNILPTLGNEFIALIKETSIISFVGALDLYKSFREIGDGTYEYVIPYLTLAVVYLILVYGITLIIKALEKSLNKSRRHL